MRVSLNRRLTKLEQTLPSRDKAQAHQAEWKRLFEEFGVPSDTPIPNTAPLVIEFIDPEDRSVVSRMLPFNGKMLTANQPENVSSDYEQHDPPFCMGGQTTEP